MQLLIAGQAVEQLEFSYIVGGNARWYNHPRTQSARSLLYDTVISLLGICLLEKWNLIFRQMSMAALFMIIKPWKPSKCPLMGEWISKICYDHTVECYSAMMRKWLLIHTAPWRNLKCIERNQSQKIPSCWFYVCQTEFWKRQKHRDRKFISGGPGVGFGTDYKVPAWGNSLGYGDCSGSCLC
jgi:hypothetical protein